MDSPEIRFVFSAVPENTLFARSIRCGSVRVARRMAALAAERLNGPRTTVSEGFLTVYNTTFTLL